MLAILATIAVSLLIAPEPGPAVLGAMLCLTLSRSQLERGAAARTALGKARRTLRDPDRLQPAHEKLRAALRGKPV